MSNTVIAYAAAETKTSTVNMIMRSIVLLLSFVASCLAILFIPSELVVVLTGLILGWHFLFHLVIPRNNVMTLGESMTLIHKDTFQQLLRAAKQGDPTAWMELGGCYLDGYGVSRNPEQAAVCFETAANLNQPEAQLQLGRCYHHGIGVTRDSALAEHWYRKAHRGGNAQAAAQLAQLLGEREA